MQCIFFSTPTEKHHQLQLQEHTEKKIHGRNSNIFYNRPVFSRNDTLDCSYPFYSGSKPEAFAFSKQKHITPPRPNSNLIMLSAIPLLDNSLFSTLYDGVSGKTGKWGRWGSLGGPSDGLGWQLSISTSRRHPVDRPDAETRFQ